MPEQKSTEMAFQIQHICTKDISFEALNVQQIFQQEWQPEGTLDLSTVFSQPANKMYAAALYVTVITPLDGKIAFPCEIKQAGIFFVMNERRRRCATLRWQ
ncbi:protein-export chaperone SecB [Bartonella australis]|nr:protein-export chaperone SecB [Bartonella australis]